ncbi:hypothetical protein ACO0OE_002483 [Hanseniaspora uvarum]
MSGNSIQEQDILNKIEREKKIIHGAQQLKSKTSNSLVIQKCMTNIRESQKNIEYLQESLRKLTLNRTKSNEQKLDAFFTLSSPKQNNNTANNSSDDLSNNGPKTRNRSNTMNQEPKYTRFELSKYDCPSLGQKIQVMLQQLEFKLQVETQYYAANEKLTRLYQIDGDQRTSNVAETGVQDSKYRVQLLRRSLKKYESLNVLPKLDQIPLNDENTSQFTKKQLTGNLNLKISSIRDVDHIISSTFSKKPDTYITLKIDDAQRGRTKTSKYDSWNEEFDIFIDKGHELELTVYDKMGDKMAPVGITWILLSDIVEELRKKRQIKNTQSGWAVAQDVIGSDHSKQTSPADVYSKKSENTLTNALTAQEEEPQTNTQVSSQVWLNLEPAGQILLSFSFDKQQTSKKRFIGGLDRHGAIIKRQEDVFEQHGHHFIQKNFYNIMCCAYCGDFLRYTGFQCLDCKFLCHKKCYQQVVTKCIAKSSSEADLDEQQLNHRIPHRFEAVSNKGTKWCCHCGYILPWGRKNVKKCSECGIMCHQNCSHLVPDFCGMDMETANKILTTIKNTKITKDRQKVVSSQGHAMSVNEQQIKPINMLSSESFTSGETYITSDSPISDDAQLIHGRKISDLKPISSLRAPSFKRPPPSMPPINDLLLANNGVESQRQPNLNDRYENHQPEFYDKSFEVFDDEEVKNFLEKEHSPTKDPRELTPELEDYKVMESNSPQNNVVTKENINRLSQHLSIAEEVTPISSPTKKSPAKTKNKKKKISLDDFMLLKVLGKGNFGKVLLAQSKTTDQLCAIKVLKKEQLLKNNDMESMKAEKKVFMLATEAKHPFLTNLYCSFQTENRVYFAMEFIGGGDLMWHVQNHRLSVKKAKFFAAEVLLALKYFHDNGVIYRDLKLENIMLTPEGHIKLADYGLCKDEMWYGCKTSTFCGTPEFIAPEILKEQQYTKSVDWWAFGVLLYQMLLCQSPFSGEDEDEVFNSILTDEPLYPIDMAGDIVQIFQGLLTKDPEERLGSGPEDALEIMREPFFRNINFDDILNMRVRPPFIPQLNGPGDTQYFEEEYTSAPPTLTPVNSILNSSMQEQFRGFSYLPQDSLL